MSKSRLIAIGGGDLSASPATLDLLRKNIEQKKCDDIVIMTVATSQHEGASAKYKKIFREMGLKKIVPVDVSSRSDGFNEKSIEAVRSADALYFTGGDQLNITSLMGGSPLHEVLRDRWNDGILIAGSSAGAAMMSGSMITSGKSDSPPKVDGVSIAPGLNLIEGTIIDTHFSGRGRHGRLLTAIAHYPQLIGIGIDSNTAAIFSGDKFRVAGEGVVTIIDGSQMHHCDLPYRRDEETVGLFGVVVHVLPAGYSYEVDTRTPIAPPLTKMAGNEGDI